MADKKVKCKYCGKEVKKVNLKDHQEDLCSKSPSYHSNIKGIGGWLVLPIIGLFYSLVIILYDLLSTNALYEFNSYIALLSFLDLVLLLWTIVALFFIFNKKKGTAKVMISLYMANIIIFSVISFLVEDYEGIFPQIIGSAIWISYFVNSKRVKNTFVN